jgi:hypothetical protein
MQKSTQQWSAFLFGVVFVIVLLALAIYFPNPSAFQYTIFRSVLALAAAGVAAMIPGFISLYISKWLRAGGALAVFAAVYFCNPAALVSSTPSQINNIRGDQNQVINGNTGTITVTNDKKEADSK